MDYLPMSGLQLNVVYRGKNYSIVCGLPTFYKKKNSINKVY